ncbi:MAG: choice-of-anchor J domain-containing protein [Salinivirgaceae bacterium]|nr:choice-of-anchor J domain-containing protein [Salinivirgaceae bacterium]
MKKTITTLIVVMGMIGSILAQTDSKLLDVRGKKSNDLIENSFNKSKEKMDNSQAERIIIQNNTRSSKIEVFSEDFSGGVLPTGWQNADNVGNGEVWVFNNPYPRTINTTSNANGFAIFDSDYNGSGSAEDCDLITSAIDCSALTTVMLSFEHYFKYGWGGAGEVSVSGDNGSNWTSLEAWGASNTANAELAEYDISAVAGGQSQVLIKWNWTGYYSYYWAVDDVKVFEPDPYALTLVVSSGESVDAGATFNYPLSIKNIGLNDDTYDLSLSTNVWTHTILAADGITPITSLSVVSGAEEDFIVQVEVPSEASNNDQDEATVTATSQGDVGVIDAKTITTTAIAPWGIGDSESFDTYLPAKWTEFQGLLAEPTTTSGTTSGWAVDGFGNVGKTGAARVNIYETSVDEWLVSPSINLGTEGNAQIEFDLALTPYTGTASANLGSDDKFAVVISTDDGTTWSSTNILIEYGDGDAISNTGDHISINLSAYTGIVKIGFYGESTVTGGDINVFIDNFEISEIIPSFDKTDYLYSLNTKEDIEAKITWESAATLQIKNEAVVLSSGTDYTLAGNDITFKSTYLENYLLNNNDTLKLNAIFNTGVEVELTFVAIYKRVDAIESFDALSYTVGTLFSELNLPDTVVATLNDGTTDTLNINWLEGDYNANEEGTYSLVGELVLSNIANPYNIKAQIDVSLGYSVYPMPYNQGFEGSWPPIGFTIHNLGDANTWVQNTSTYFSGSASASITYGSTAHNDWLITPKIAISGVNPTLGGWFGSASATFLEPYDVLISTTTTDIVAFTDTLKEESSPGTSWEFRTIDLSAYIGQEIYIAFRSTTTDKYKLFVDELIVDNFFDVTFNVTGVSGVLEGADVTFNGSTLATDATGTAIFKRPAGEYDYDIEATKYLPIEGAATIVDQNLTIDITMDSIYVVEFTASDGAAMKDVVISYTADTYEITGELTTDVLGKASVDLPADSYTFTANKVGYAETADVYTVVDDTLPVAITMSTTPATFAFITDYEGNLVMPNTVVDFTSATMAITFANIGQGTITINPSDITFDGADASEFVFENIALENVLATGKDTTLLITFKPTSAGLKTAAVHITDNISKATHDIIVTGEAHDSEILTVEEDFETGGSYNWMFTQDDQVNQWVIGEAADDAGNQSAYISNDGSTNAYSHTTSVSHMHLDVAIPDGTTLGEYVLNFDWKCAGEYDYDDLKVFLKDPTNAISEGLALTGQIGTYDENTEWTRVFYKIPVVNFDTTKRFVFSWRNDEAVGVQPPIAIDNIYVGAGLTDAEITSFDIQEVDAYTTFDDTTIYVAVGIGTDLSSLTPIIEILNGGTVSPASGVTQNLSDTLVYTVTAQDGVTIQEYKVITTIDYKITFSLTDGTNPIAGLEIDVEGEILTTNAEGKATTVVKAGDYNYTITNVGWVTNGGTVSVTNNDVTENVLMVPQYEVIFGVDGSNGTLIAEVASVEITSGDYITKGQTVTFTATPNTNYKVKEWTLNGTANTSNFTNSYVVSNISANKEVTVAFEGTDATLSSLLIDGVLIDGFATDVYLYVVDLPCGTPTPVVSGVATDANAVINDANQADFAVNDTVSVIKVTAEDGTTILTYQVKFAIEAPDFYELAASLISETGFTTTLTPAFAGLTKDNFVLSLSQVSSTIIEITEVIESAAGVTYTFTAGLTQAESYHLNVVGIEECSAFTEDLLIFVPDLGNLLVSSTTPIDQAINVEPNAKIEVIFDEQITELDLTGISINPAPQSLTAVINTNNNGIILNHDNLEFNTVYTVTIPADAVLGVTSTDENDLFTWSFTTREVSTNSLLSSLSLDGFELDEFDAAVISYSRTYPYGTETIPLVDAIKADPKATISIVQATSLPGTATVTVTAEDESTTVYTVEFLVEPNDDATLASINVNSTAIIGFDPVVLEYDVILPAGTTTPPVVTAVAIDLNATVVPTQTTELPGTATILVTAEDGVTNLTYTVNFTVAISTDATLSDLKVNGTTIDEFDAATLAYSVELPYGTTTVPTITVATTYADATYVITPAGGLPGSSTILVTAEDGTTQLTYSVLFTIAASTDATLSDIKVDGISIPEFNPAVLIYSVELPYGTTTVPAVTAFTTDINATKVITQATVLPGAATIVVTAEDGSTELTYTVNFTITPANTDATLSEITVSEGVLDPVFDAAVFSYEVELPYGTSTVPTVTATTSDENATMLITPATVLPGATTIVVTAEDGSTELTYTVNFTITPANTDATLSELTVSEGVLDPVFDAAVFSYEVKLPAGSTDVPTSAATATDANASVVINYADDLTGTTEIVVTAEDGTTELTYSLEYTVLDDISDASEILMSVYPNPFNNELVLENLENVSLVIIHNVAGQVISKNTEFNDKLILNTSEFKQGVYFVSVVGKNNIIKTQKMVKE